MHLVQRLGLVRVVGPILYLVPTQPLPRFSISMIALVDELGSPGFADAA